MTDKIIERMKLPKCGIPNWECKKCGNKKYVILPFTKELKNMGLKPLKTLMGKYGTF
jgi:hypothetical protein